MHTYLKAWRLSKKLSLEAVAELLGKTHTTISRWETGVVRIKATDLEKLAAIYNATPTQLAGPPESADLILILDRTQSIVEHMDAETREQWLAIGERLSKK